MNYINQKLVLLFFVFFFFACKEKTTVLKPQIKDAIAFSHPDVQFLYQRWQWNGALNSHGIYEPIIYIAPGATPTAGEIMFFNNGSLFVDNNGVPSTHSFSICQLKKVEDLVFLVCRYDGSNTFFNVTYCASNQELRTNLSCINIKADSICSPLKDNHDNSYIPKQ